jgi:hypothetical protein
MSVADRRPTSPPTSAPMTGTGSTVCPSAPHVHVSPVCSVDSQLRAANSAAVISLRANAVPASTTW